MTMCVDGVLKFVRNGGDANHMPKWPLIFRYENRYLSSYNAILKSILMDRAVLLNPFFFLKVCDHVRNFKWSIGHGLIDSVIYVCL